MSHPVECGDVTVGATRVHFEARAAGGTGSRRPGPRLAIVPGRTRAEVRPAPELVSSTAAFLGAEAHRG